LNDPGPASTNSRGLDTLVQLQTFTSIFWKDPRVFNAVAYAICGLLLLAWMLVTLRARPTATNTWLALAAISALSLLPVYHRTHDARILLLTIPACVSLWSEGGTIGWWAVLVNLAGTLSIGEIPSMIRVSLVSRWVPDATEGWTKIPVAILTRPVPLILLATAIFYLWIYFRRAMVQSQDPIAQGTTKPRGSR
jgi:hypothetical protein